MSKGTATKLRKAQAVAREYQKIITKKRANELRISKEKQRAIAEKKARVALRDAIAASVKEHKRLRTKHKTVAAASAKVDCVAIESKKAPKGFIVVRRRDGRETKLRSGRAGKRAKCGP